MERFNRRGWLRSTGGVLAASAAGLRVWGEEAGKPEAAAIKIENADPEQVAADLKRAGLGEPNRLRSNHYLAIGDAAESFMRSSLTDCELLLIDYMEHFRRLGFDVHEPTEPLLVVALKDDVSFGRYHKMPSLMHGGAQAVGMYDKATNLLSVFDWRNVPMASRASNRNVQTVSHEGTHQLTFNTGLLDRRADVPLAVVEGLGTYGEPRKVMGPSEFGRVNLQRADDLARLRRSVPWIPIRDLLMDDSILRAGLVARVMLAYAESWALIHCLMHDPERVVGFRAYLTAIRSRTTSEQRLDDLRRHLGDLDQLDRAVEAHVVRVVRSL